jgi:ABC-2 type transport system ATP-binding protein
VELELDDVSPELAEKLRAQATSIRVLHGHTFVVVEGDANVPGILKLAIEAGAQVHAVIPHRETLEDLFVRKAVTEAA